MPKGQRKNPFAGARARSNGNGNGAGLSEVEHDTQQLPPPRGRKPGRAPEFDPAEVLDDVPPARVGGGRASGEVAAMHKMQQALVDLEPDARERVMRWLSAFYESIAD